MAGAERIGHGVDVMYEDDARELLKEMADKHVMVEINLSSNEGILGVEGDEHPFPVYRSAHVPVALSTDDEGVSRIDLTHEYVRAAHRLPPDLPRPEATGADRDGAQLSARREPVGKPDDLPADGRTRAAAGRSAGTSLRPACSRFPRREREGRGAVGAGAAVQRVRGEVPRAANTTGCCMDNERIREICMAMPHVCETVNWGHHLVYWVGDRDIGGKMFAMTDLDGSGTGVLWFHCGAERFHELLESRRHHRVAVLWPRFIG